MQADRIRRWAFGTMTGVALVLIGQTPLEAQSPRTFRASFRKLFLLKSQEPAATGQCTNCDPCQEVGNPFYDFSQREYGIWRRPRALGLGRAERCRPAPFRPRGYGNLFARPSTCDRLDYHPFMIEDVYSPYGPAYYNRPEDPRCKSCQHCGHCKLCRLGQN